MFNGNNIQLSQILLDPQRSQSIGIMLAKFGKRSPDDIAYAVSQNKTTTTTTTNTTTTTTTILLLYYYYYYYYC